MASLPSSVLPRNLAPAVKRGGSVEFSPKLSKTAALSAEQVLAELETKIEGLSEEEAAQRLEVYGPNIVADEQRFTRLKLFIRACLNPLVILLTVLAVISFATAEETSDYVGGALMVIMVVLGVSLRFIQEARADAAADRIPADIRLLSCKDLFLTQASLTGESFPVEKFDRPEPSTTRSPLELTNGCFLRASVEGGASTPVVIEPALKTSLGTMASAITQRHPPTSFDRGVAPLP